MELRYAFSGLSLEIIKTIAYAAKSMNPRWGSVDTSLTVTLSPTSGLCRLNDLAVHVRIEGADEGPVIVHASHDGRIALANVRMEHHGGDAFLHVALNLARAVFHQRAALGDGIELIVGVGRRLLGEPGFEQALRDHIGKAAIGRGGVRVVLHREAEVAG